MKINLKIRKELLLLVVIVFLSSCISNVEEEIIEQVGEEPIENVLVSFKDAVKPIIDARCASCHSTSGGTFPNLTNYDEVNEKSDRVKVRVDNRTMPQSGTLSDAQIKIIVDWVDEGALNN